ncbi:MAG: GxxExxY protein [Muribaculaceae bacterium]|nr:GxxExxY protein [Muribaculaceae bacterium]
MEFIYKEETYKIRGCAMSVHSELGSGFLEKVYQEALALEFKDNNIPFKREAELIISYKGRKLQQHYFADFICYDDIIIEIKAVSELNDNHRSQVFNYLKATGLSMGLLINFGERSVRVERIVNFKKSV